MVSGAENGLSSSSSAATNRAVLAFLAALTVAHLWPVVSLAEFGSRIQTRDSALCMLIMSHIARVLCGQASLWDLGIFYPLPDTLCLSEPMLTQGVMLTPVTWLFGPAAAQNTWLYVCWFASAAGAYAWLRHRQLGPVAALWGAVFAVFTPDRMWHAAGHGHLLFHAGFPLALLALEKAFAPPWRARWSLFFAAVVTAQLFCGFYLAALFLLWLAVLGPVSAWQAAEGTWRTFHTALRRHALVLLASTALIAIAFGTVAAHYQRFAAGFPQNPLEMLVRASADWRGYLLPASDPDGVCTLQGLLHATAWGSVERGENTQPIGISGLIILGMGIVLVVRALVRKAAQRRQVVFWCAVVVLFAASVLLSFGPYAGRAQSGATRLPFAWLYAYVPPLRFIRAPARFAFLAQWCLALMGAHTIESCSQGLRRRGWSRVAAALPASLLLLAVVEFFPLTRTKCIAVRSSELARHLQQDSQAVPFVEIPTKLDTIMVRCAQHGVPVANGYSGYYPPMREPELGYLETHFPAPEALALFDHWSMNRVFVSANASRAQTQAAMASPFLRKLWRGDEGTLYEVLDTAPRVGALRARAPASSGTLCLVRNHEPSPSYPLSVHGMYLRKPPDPAHPYVRWQSTKQAAPFEFDLQSAPVYPAGIARLQLRICVANWYDLREYAAVAWTTAARPDYGPDRLIQFCLPCDGQFHDICIDVSGFVPWLADDPVTRLRLHAGRRCGNTVALESFSLETQ